MSQRIDRTTNPIINNFSGVSQGQQQKSSLKYILDSSNSSFSNFGIRISGDQTLSDTRGLYQKILDVTNIGGTLPEGWEVVDTRTNSFISDGRSPATYTLDISFVIYSGSGTNPTYVYTANGSETDGSISSTNRTVTFDTVIPQGQVYTVTQLYKPDWTSGMSTFAYTSNINDLKDVSPTGLDYYFISDAEATGYDATTLGRIRVEFDGSGNVTRLIQGGTIATPKEIRSNFLGPIYKGAASQYNPSGTDPYLFLTNDGDGDSQYPNDTYLQYRDCIYFYNQIAEVSDNPSYDPDTDKWGYIGKIYLTLNPIEEANAVDNYYPIIIFSSQDWQKAQRTCFINYEEKNPRNRRAWVEFKCLQPSISIIPVVKLIKTHPTQ